MPANILMVILIALPQGGVSASFVNVDALEECESRLGRIRPVLEQESDTLLHAGCHLSTAQFSLFDHDPPVDAPRFPYEITIKGASAEVRRLAGGDDCDSSGANRGEMAFALCVTSTQELISTEQ
ncbi:MULTISPECIES: hypothetical protein [Alphaproteobacteria]|uniref:Uncharacterized protein n=2 Tax=Alphaproteobacteria TaxID=28211 RepID=A0A512HM27_9HYPH|nr:MULTISPECIES: hypothetical protein [Alphaproteobacteria]GEO86512.1 hypothetical protein RNA01_34440 [Ciceribacter naphthalenivorans]GLR23869.1 hypothetical protein GCM10007920_36610 [Ciceribacter naphthalenivorans]GLT06725.1 hypothetical protein GCM10007926_36610 [Sphingomonas psychrolutea]